MRKIPETSTSYSFFAVIVESTITDDDYHITCTCMVSIWSVSLLVVCDRSRRGTVDPVLKDHFHETLPVLGNR